MNADVGAKAPAMSQDSTDGLPRPRRYVAVVAVSLGTILTTVDGTIVNVALPTLARDLNVEDRKSTRLNSSHS